MGSHDATTGLIVSEGSRFKDPDNVLCLTININTRFYKQRVRLAVCNADDVLQQLTSLTESCTHEATRDFAVDTSIMFMLLLVMRLVHRLFSALAIQTLLLLTSIACHRSFF